MKTLKPMKSPSPKYKRNIFSYAKIYKFFDKSKKFTLFFKKKWRF